MRVDAASAPVEVRHPRAWLTLAILFLLVVLSYVDRMTIVLMVGPIKHDLALSDLQISYLQGIAFALCFALAGPPLAWAADRYSRTGVIFCGVTVWSLATMASGLVDDYAQLLAARFAVGIGEAALMPAAFALLADLFPRRQHALAFGIVSAGAAVGGSLAIGGGGYALQTMNAAGGMRPWQLIFVLVGAPGIGAASLVFLIPDVRAQPLRSPDGGPGSATLRGWITANPLFTDAFTLAISLLCAVAYGITNWVPAFLTRTYGASVGSFAFTLAAIQLMGGLGGFIGGGYLTDRMALRGARNAPYRYLSGVAVLLLLSGLGAFAWQGGLNASLACLMLFYLAVPYTGMVATELQMTAPRHLRAQAIAAVTAIYTLVGMVTGPTSVAWLTDRVFRDEARLGISLAIVTVIYCPIVLLLLLVSRRAAARAIARARET